MIKIHYRNQHGTTNLSWQKAFRKYGELSLGPVTSGGFPKEIDHLHLGGSCKGSYSIKSNNPITVEEVKKIQLDTGCAVSVFFGDPVFERFRFHHDLLDADIPKLKIYSAALYGTPMWRSEVIWVLHPTDEDVFRLVEHKKNDTVLFVGELTLYRRKIVKQLNAAGIKVDIVGSGGNISTRYGEELVELSKNYSISIGIAYDMVRPKIRYSSSRLPNALAMGLIYMEADFDLKGVFESNEILQWNSVNDLINKIKYYQRNIEEGYEIIMRGRKRVLDNWTFTKLAEKFLSIKKQASTITYDLETGILFDGKYSLDKKLIKTICETFNPVKIADLGCGRGDYCKVCLDYGYEVYGYEGSQIACQKAVCGNIECVDLTNPVEPKDDYDLVLCLEVGEHIPKKHQAVFIDNLNRFSKDVLILSWAVPGQKGTGHVNCLSNEDVIELLKKKGFSFDRNMSEYLRQNSTLSWFRNTLMVFRRVK